MLPVGPQAPLSESVDGTKQFRRSYYMEGKRQVYSAKSYSAYLLVSFQASGQQNSPARHTTRDRQGLGRGRRVVLVWLPIKSILLVSCLCSIPPIYIPSSQVLPIDYYHSTVYSVHMCMHINIV